MKIWQLELNPKIGKKKNPRDKQIGIHEISTTLNIGRYLQQR